MYARLCARHRSRLSAMALVSALGLSVRASTSLGDLRAEFTRDVSRERLVASGVGSALILHRIVEEGRYGLVFGSAVFQHQRANAEQMRHVRRSGRFPPLLAMQLTGKLQGPIEAIAEHQTFCTAAFQPANNSSRRASGICGSNVFSARQNRSTSSVLFQIPVARPAI